MSNGMGNRPRILAIDAGGTMTDTFIINERGEFVVGKAQTTPHDESIGFLNSARDALHYWGIGVEEAFSAMVSGIYSGTVMLNRLLERKGRTVGLIVTAGMEDYLRMERAIQTYLGYSYSDRLHVVTHHHNPPSCRASESLACVSGLMCSARLLFRCTNTKCVQQWSSCWQWG